MDFQVTWTHSTMESGNGINFFSKKIIFLKTQFVLLFQIVRNY